MSLKCKRFSTYFHKKLDLCLVSVFTFPCKINKIDFVNFILCEFNPNLQVLDSFIY